MTSATGDAMTDAPPLSFPVEVAGDTPCRQCEYNLRGLRRDALCPECGTPVALSVRDDRLLNANPVWVRTLRRGVLLRLWAMLLFVPVQAVALLLIRTMRGGPFPTLLYFPTAALSLAGIWLATTPDPGGTGEDTYGAVRKTARLTAVISLCGRVLQPLLWMAMLPLVLSLAHSIIDFALSAVAIVCEIAFLSLLANLASRIPDDRLVRWLRFLMFAMGTCSCVAFLNAIAFNLWFHFAGPGMFVVGNRVLWFRLVPLGVIGLATFIFAIMEVIMLIKLSRGLRRAATLAEQAWQPMPPGL